MYMCSVDGLNLFAFNLMVTTVSNKYKNLHMHDMPVAFC